MRVELDQWNANRCSEEIIDANDSTEIMDIVSRLDGERHTLMTIITDDCNFMVGGGPNQFIIIKQNSDGSSMSLSNGLSVEVGKRVYLCAGGQEGDYDSQIIVNKALVESFVNDIIEKKDDSEKVWLPD